MMENLWFSKDEEVIGYGFYLSCSRRLRVYSNYNSGILDKMWKTSEFLELYEGGGGERGSLFQPLVTVSVLNGWLVILYH